MNADPACDTCICFQENEEWYSTGTLQYSWHNTYIGFSAVWDQNCDFSYVLMDSGIGGIGGCIWRRVKQIRME